MKKVKNTGVFLALSLIILFTSCDDEISRESTHTDASAMVVGSFSGILSYEDNSYSNTTVVFTKIENDSVQAVTFNIQSPDFNFSGASGLNLSGTLNVATANNGYLMASAYTTTSKLTGKVTNNNLMMTLPIQVRSSNFEVRFHSNGLNWKFIGTKN